MELRKMPHKPFTDKTHPSNADAGNSAYGNSAVKNGNCPDQIGSSSQYWNDPEKLKVFREIDINADWILVRSRMNLHHHKSVLFTAYFIRVAALVILTSGLSFAFYKFLILNKHSGNGLESVMAGNQTKSFFLPDGSAVSLNAGSSLSYGDDFGVNSRNVVLNGEGFFHVIPGSTLPFRVLADHSVIEVTGTRFNVNEINGAVHVTVLSGSVLLSSAGKTDQKIRIPANCSGHLLSDNQLIVEKGIPVNVLSWNTGHLSFDETPIDSALIDIASHFRRQLIMDDKLNEKITAEFHNQPLHEILNELSLVAGLKFDTTGTALIVRK